MKAVVRIFLTIAATFALGGCFRSVRGERSDGSKRAADTLTSNIVRADYAGSSACAPCHPDVYAAWSKSPMHQMTRVPETAEIKAPFDGRTWSFKDDSVVFEQASGYRFMRLHSKRLGDHLYRVTRVIGGRTREDFAGLEVSSTTPDARVLGPKKSELILPASYVFESESFRLKGYSVMVGERPGLQAGGVWNENCVFCHNTVPYFDSLWGALYGSGAPGYQGRVVDKTLPPDRRFHFSITDDSALRSALADEVRHVGGSLAEMDVSDTRTVLGRAIHVMRDDFDAADFVEIGIGCEACHGGSREHVRNPRVRPRFLPTSSFLEVRPPADRDPSEVKRSEQINRTCARCHQVLFSRYPFTWEGGLRRSSTAGGSSINSGEARDLLLGGCSHDLSCVACHDPHGKDDPDKLARLATPEGNATCTGCHASLASAPALQKHAHHDPKGAGGACIACHMPKKNTALTYGLSRYHRIGSPTDKNRVEQDRPLECSLCHAKKSTEEIVSTMEKWWQKKYDRQTLRILYGDLNESPVMATLVRGKSHEQIAAFTILREARVTQAYRDVARWLVHPTPLVRYHAKKAFDALAPEPCPVSLDESVEQIAAAVRACVPGITLPLISETTAPSSGGADED